MGSICRLEELTFPELDALDRQRTVVIFACRYLVAGPIALAGLLALYVWTRF